MGRSNPGHTHLVLLAAQRTARGARESDWPSTPPAAATSGERPSQPPQEIVLDGRKYRLVPVDGEAAPSPLPSPPPPPAVPRVAVTDLLTARELQIVALVAEGRPNKQIAAELSISEWTVSTHLRRIYAKLDVDTRAAMVSRCFDVLASLIRPEG